MDKTEPLTVCYFGAYRPEYPRNLFYRQALQQQGHEVIECRVSVKERTIVRALRLLVAFWRGVRRADVMVVPEFNHTLVPLAWLLARLRGMALIFDPGLSYYDEIVLRAKDVLPNSLHGMYLRWMETLVYCLPDVVVWFTPVDEEYFQALFRIPPQRSAWLPPGIDQSLFYPTPLPTDEPPFILHWDGNMSPTHGADVILQSARLLASEPEYRFEFFGSVLAEVRSLAGELCLPNVQFEGKVPPEELRASVQRAHVCLGVFRGDDKLRRSLYTKEMQAMMAGRPLITAYGEAKARLFRDGEDLVMVPPEDPVALAEAIRSARNDPAKRAKLAANGAAALAKLCAADAAGVKMHSIIERAYAQRRR